MEPIQTEAENEKKQAVTSSAPGKQNRRRERKSDRTLRLLVQGGEKLGSTLKLASLYEALLDTVREGMPCDGFLVSSYNAQTEEITCEFCFTDGKLVDVSTFPKLPVRSQGGMQSEVIRSGRSQIFADVDEKVSEPGGNYFEVSRDGSIKSLKHSKTQTKAALMTPIRLDEVVVGVVQVSCTGGDVPYDLEDVRLLEGLVHQLAIGAQNARLYERAKLEIAERRRVEEGLRAAEAKLLQTLDAMPNMAWTTAPDGRALAVNKRLLEYAGFKSSEELLGSAGWTMLIHRDDRSKVLAGYTASFTGPDPWEAEVRIRRRDGQYRWHLARTVPILNADGSVDRWFGTSTDIHDLKVANAALQTVLENAPDPIFRIDRAMRWLYVNPAATKLLKLEGHRIHSPLDEEKMPPGLGRLVQLGCLELFGGKAETTFDFEVDLRHYTARAVQEQGRLDVESGALFICRDVTGQMEIQETLTNMNEELERRVDVRTQELASSIQEMEGFTYSISHDFRAPLRAISATCSMLMEDFGDKLDQEGRELLVRQSRAASKLGHVIDALLQFSRFSRAEMQIKDIDLTALAHSIIEEIAISEPTVADRVAVQPGMIACGDISTVGLVLRNLIENAIKFSGASAKVEVGESSPHVFFVRDHGIGFDPEYADKIWRPFERLVSESQFPGTGIGLANVKRIIDRHGGAVWVESKTGEGATFYFTLSKQNLRPTVSNQNKL